jgi:hypothetical protein
LAAAAADLRTLLHLDYLAVLVAVVRIMLPPLQELQEVVALLDKAILAELDHPFLLEIILQVLVVVDQQEEVNLRLQAVKAVMAVAVQTILLQALLLIMPEVVVAVLV